MADRYGPDAVRFRKGACVLVSTGYAGDRRGTFVRMVPEKLHADAGWAYVKVGGRTRKVRYEQLWPCGGGS